MNFNNITPVVKNLILINIVFFIGSNIAENSLGEQTISNWLAVHYPTCENFKPIQLITYMFMHGSISHIFFNMFGLFMFGPPIEYNWGPKRFLFYYLATGFGALILDFAVKYFQIHYTNISLEEVYALVNTPMVGASGAIFGLLAAYAMMYPNNVIQLLFPPIPLKAKYFVLIYAAFELFSGVTGYQPGVGHFAHLGGALFGVLLILYWRNGGTIGKN